MEKVLIVGVNSFLAVQIAKILKGSFEITGIYNTNKNNIPSDISIYSIDAIDQLKDEYKFVFVISAYIPDKNNIDEEKLQAVNVDLTKKLLDKFISSRFIFASSVSVYGNNQVLIDEKSIGENVAAYGLSKLKAEELIKKHHSYAVLRISSMYGVGMKTNTFLPLIIKNALLSGKINVYGDGTRLQNYIHVEDVAEMMCQAALCEQNFVGLAVGKNSFSNWQVAELVKEHINEVIIEKVGEDKEISYEYNANYTYNLLNFIPRRELRGGILELIEWIKR